MAADAGEMKLECGSAFIVDCGAGEVSVSGERDFRIDDEVAAARQRDDDICTNRTRPVAVFAINASEDLLEAVLLAFVQAGLFEKIAENEFAPVALGFGRAAQRRGEIACVF